MIESSCLSPDAQREAIKDAVAKLQAELDKAGYSVKIIYESNPHWRIGAIVLESSERRSWAPRYHIFSSEYDAREYFQNLDLKRTEGRRYTSLNIDLWPPHALKELSAQGRLRDHRQPV